MICGYKNGKLTEDDTQTNLVASAIRKQKNPAKEMFNVKFYCLLCFLSIFQLGSNKAIKRSVKKSLFN